jgi:molybdopterin converting factor small subunit
MSEAPFEGARDADVRDAEAQVEVVLPGVLAQDAGGVRKVMLTVPLGERGVRLGQVLDALAAAHPLVGRRLRDEAGVVRRHVNLFVDGQDVRSAGGQDMAVASGSTVLVLPNVAGG